MTNVYFDIDLPLIDQQQGHVIVKHNLLFFHLDWGWVSFFYALKYGPFLGRFKYGLLRHNP